MPNIAQQDYIIIDWEGKDDSDAAKKAEVDAVLKNIFNSNPLTLLSVVFKNYGSETLVLRKAVSLLDYGDDSCNVAFIDADDASGSVYKFSIA